MPGVELPKQIFIGSDQFLKTLIGGWADETFSACCWRCQAESRFWKWARRVADTLLFFDKNHCEESFYSEFERNQLSSGYG